MLRKLLKYDIEYTYKTLIFFYLLSIFFAILTRIFLSIDNSVIFNIIGKICSGVTISMMFNIVINNLIRLWVRFKNNFYSDESYLTHTLPVDKKTHYLSKFVSSNITLFISVAVIAISLFIAYYSKTNIEALKNVLLPLVSVYNSTITKFIFVLLFILFLEFLNILQMGYTGILLGHKMNNNKIAYSMLYGFIAYMASQCFVLISVFITALFNKEIMNLFHTIEIVNIDVFKTLIYISLITYSLSIAIGYIINLIIFKKGVNVD